ncbi:iron transporter [uncultured Actinomyces sp.]|jgi:putative pathogen-specific surface antigen|uniref:iron transporter n=1 Tax=uncultured Actinomyces sp. TaxID=249061 RepID=UPI00260F006D|nr:iron transporter [uncultured Actinomyces sp.]
MRIRKPLIVAATLALAGTLSLSACGDSPKEAAPSATATEKAEGGKGFQEYPVGDDQIGYGNGNVGEINVSLVYFQPVDMEPAGMGLKASEASFHLEADISGLEGNDLGYGAGDFVPGLTVDYTITNKATNTVAAEGTFMQMNASDGPHYGGNIALPDAGEYTLALKIHSPEENGWMLHSDEETGVKGRFWTTPIELSWDWNYTPQQW